MEVSFKILINLVQKHPEIVNSSLIAVMHEVLYNSDPASMWQKCTEICCFHFLLKRILRSGSETVNTDKILFQKFG